MKELKQFLIENVVNIFEAHFEAGDYLKDNFKYPKAVIADLLAGNDFGLGVHNDKIIELDPEDVEQFNNDYSEENFPTTSDEFNAMISKYKSFPKWRAICKDKYSGKTTNTKGQRAEGLVCYIFNEADADIEAFKNEMMPDLDNSWIDSSYWTVDFMNKQKGVSGIEWTRDNYVACRVDGGDFRLDSKYNFAVEVTSIFSGKSAMKKILGINCNDLYSGSKDIWNKADIIYSF